MGPGTARGGHLACTEESRWVRIPQGPQIEIWYKTMNEEQKQKIVEFCINIYAHAQLDWEINIAGNGCNISDVYNVADELFQILNLNKKKFAKQINQRVKELKDEIDYSNQDTKEEYEQYKEQRRITIAKTYSEIYPPEHPLHNINNSDEYKKLEEKLIIAKQVLEDAFYDEVKSLGKVIGWSYPNDEDGDEHDYNVVFLYNKKYFVIREGVSYKNIKQIKKCELNKYIDHYNDEY